jgi:predicted nucleotidyltransferase
MVDSVTERRINHWLKQAKEDRMDNKDIVIKKAAEYLNETFEISAIYIFGSVIGENFNEDSDIDMAIFLKDYNKYSLKDFAKILFYVQNHISSRIELHFFPDKSEPLTFSAHIKNISKKVA